MENIKLTGFPHPVGFGLGYLERPTWQSWIPYVSQLKGKNTCFFEDPGARTPNMDRFWPISRKSPLETSNHPKTPKSQKKSKKKSKLLRVLDVKTVKYRCLIITVYCIQLLWSFFESGLLFKIVYRKLDQSLLSAVRGTGIFSQTMPSFFCWLFVRFLITNPESTAAIPKLQVSFLAMCLAKCIKFFTSGESGIFWHYPPWN